MSQCVPSTPTVKQQMLNVSSVSPSRLQAAMFQEGLRFAETIKGGSQAVATEVKTATEAGVQKRGEEEPSAPKKHGKQR